MLGARSPAKVGAPGAGFHGVAPASDDVTRCAETKRTKDTEERSGWAVVTGAIARTHPGEWLSDEEGRGPEPGSLVLLGLGGLLSETLGGQLRGEALVLFLAAPSGDNTDDLADEHEGSRPFNHRR